MRTDIEDEAATKLIISDLSDIAVAVNNLAHHVFIMIGVSGFGISVLQIIASIAAMYVLIILISNNYFTCSILLYKQKFTF
jgi:adenosine/AMP kinase